jgi:hypothetical protein
MREAMIIIPTHDNDGNRLDHLREAVMVAACDRYGGCTVQPGAGAWVAGDRRLVQEAVWLVHIAMADTRDNAAHLSGLADLVAHSGRQEAVYVRYASGVVAIREYDLNEIAAAA